MKSGQHTKLCLKRYGKLLYEYLQEKLEEREWVVNNCECPVDQTGTEKYLQSTAL